MSLITIHTVTYPSEAHVLKVQLEDKGFYVFLKDELTVQTDNFLSNAIGGVKIQVKEENAQEAYDVLMKLGYINIEVNESKTFLDRLYSFTSRIPIIKKFIPEIRLLVLVGLILLLVLIPIFYYQRLILFPN